MIRLPAPHKPVHVPLPELADPAPRPVDLRRVARRRCLPTMVEAICRIVSAALVAVIGTGAGFGAGLALIAAIWLTPDAVAMAGGFLVASVTLAAMATCLVHAAVTIATEGW